MKKWMDYFAFVISPFLCFAFEPTPCCFSRKLVPAILSNSRNDRIILFLETTTWILHGDLNAYLSAVHYGCFVLRLSTIAFRIQCKFNDYLVWYILGGEQLLNTLKKGDFFGERALEDSQGKRTANIIANPGDDGGEYYWFSITN